MNIILSCNRRNQSGILTKNASKRNAKNTKNTGPSKVQVELVERHFTCLWAFLSFFAVFSCKINSFANCKPYQQDSMEKKVEKIYARWRRISKQGEFFQLIPGSLCCLKVKDNMPNSLFVFQQWWRSIEHLSLFKSFWHHLFGWVIYVLRRFWPFQSINLYLRVWRRMVAR